MDLGVRKLQLALRRSGQDVVCVPTSLIKEIIPHIRYSLGGWHDYGHGEEEMVCDFCHGTPNYESRALFKYSEEDIVHRESCKGVAIMAALQDALRSVEEVNSDQRRVDSES